MLRIALTALAVILVSGCVTGSMTAEDGRENMANSVALFDTSMGQFKAELFEERAPITTKNFIDLSNRGFYNRTIFHRVIDGFMIQGGDPTGTGTGGPVRETTGTSGNRTGFFRGADT